MVKQRYLEKIECIGIDPVLLQGRNCLPPIEGLRPPRHRGYSPIVLKLATSRVATKGHPNVSYELQLIGQQETVTHCLLFILQPIYLHNLSPHTSSNSLPFTNGFSIFWLIKSLARVFEMLTD